VTHAKPVRLVDAEGQVAGVEFESAEGGRFVIEADMVLKAIGQVLDSEGLAADLLTLDGSRLAVDSCGRTSLDNVWAGGDCAASGGLDLTVQAVQDGKIAAESIDTFLAASAIKAA
jgi:dihydropyrimidine dehydrogenase (NAD+) subunit PreT